ncbi:hypothetical protein D6C86_09012 [Aureobasidium pullulans]|uniref:MFS general substrate transporter n=1 Tax=Aureobasidium pullulans TaxID=5580 RepID=A0A4S9PIN9_AURPU|nr:hypothetical protein D6C94_08759 [Aureobasidium pullulans]THZ34593.1 hypothetical protein D6C87_10345 [Aureobasidium pullulans]THZ55004.1 hypothetical protein D6C86_09012 [Aureobasidium pullulans]THZ57513.1 hypothetical protein D6C88_09124 [Aureobasidium pullulans]
MFAEIWNYLCWFLITIFTDAGLTEGYLNGSLGAVTLILGMMSARSVFDVDTRLYMDITLNVGMVIGMALSGRYTDRISSKWMIFFGTSTTVFWSILCALISLASVKNDAQLLTLKILFAVSRSGFGFGLGVEFVGTFVMNSDKAFHLIQGREWRALFYSETLQYHLGYLLSNLVPFVLFLIYDEGHLQGVLTACLTIGAILPLHTWSCHIVYCCTKANETGAQRRMRIARTRIPPALSNEFYQSTLITIAMAWAFYEMSATGLGLYVPTEVLILNGNQRPNLWRMFGWTSLICAFNVLGSILGMYFTAKRLWGPKKTLIIGTAIQGVFGVLIVATVGTLLVSPLSPVLMVFFAFFHLAQEFGAGSNMALLAVGTCAPSVRGRYLGYAAAASKLGAIAGDILILLTINYIEAKDEGDSGATYEEALTYPFGIATLLLVLATILAVTGLPKVEVDFNLVNMQALNRFLQNWGYRTTDLDRFELPPPSPTTSGSANRPARAVPSASNRGAASASASGRGGFNSLPRMPAAVPRRRVDRNSETAAGPAQPAPWG